MRGDTLAALRALSAEDVAYATRAESLVAGAHVREHAGLLAEFGASLLSTAIYDSRVGLARLLVEDVGFGREDVPGYFPLAEGADCGSLEVLDVLLTSGLPLFNVRRRQKQGDTAMHVACSRGHVEIVELFIQHGFPVNMRETYEYSSAIGAIQNGHEACLRALLMAGAHAGAKFTAEDGLESTLLDVAVEWNKPAAACLLLRALPKDGNHFELVNRALCLSSRVSRHRTIPSLLLDAGASLDCTDSNGVLESTPFFLAVRQHDRLARWYLRKFGSHVMEKDDEWEMMFIPEGGSEALFRRNVCKYMERLLRLGFSLSTDKLWCDAWWVACYKDNARLAKLLLRYGPSVSDRTLDSDAPSPPFFAAIRMGSRRCFKILLAFGADVKERHYRSPLTAAMLRDDLDVYRELVRAGVSPRVPSGETMTSLRIYLRELCDRAELDTEISVDALRMNVFKEVVADVDINDSCSDDGFRAIHLAVRYGLEPQAAFLLDETNANVNARDDCGVTPLMSCVFGGWPSTSKLLLAAKPDLSLRTTAPFLVNFGNIHVAVPGTDAFLFAAFSCNEDAAKSLLEHGADVQSCDSRGRNAIWLAMHEATRLSELVACSDMVETLLDVGVCVNSTDAKTGLQTVHVAAKAGCFSVLSQLSINGADVNATDNFGNTALHWAARSNGIVSDHVIAGTFMSVLVRDLGADVHARNADGETALHIASRECNTFDAAALIDAGANMDDRDSRGRTPLMLACSRKHRPRGRYLETNGRFNKVELSPTLMVQFLIARGADLSYRSGRGLQALHYASTCGLTVVCRLLVMNRARVNARSESGRTALHLACRHGHHSLAYLLASREARVNLRDKGGRTPLHEAATYGHAACVSVLLRFEADAAIVCDAGRRPSCEASRRGHAHVVWLLASVEKTSINDKDEGCTLPGREMRMETEMTLVGCEDLLLGSSV